MYESIEVAALFLDEGDKIVETKSRGGVTIRTFTAREDGIYKDGALTVLINGQTASAAEIVAGAIQDNDRGLIIGSTSFGKGLVQQVLRFSDQSALKLTTAKYHTPSNRCIQKNQDDNELLATESDDSKEIYFTQAGRPVFGGGGIVPDIYVEPHEELPVVNEVVTLGYVDDFADHYRESLKVEKNIEINDELLNDFFDYLHANNYIYKDDASLKFAEFKQSLGNLADEATLEEPVDDIESFLRQSSLREIQEAAPVFKQILYEHIITRQFGEKTALELARQYTDAELIQASEVLKDPDMYSSLLVGY
jgi:carboxyl-terminal processing protease